MENFVVSARKYRPATFDMVVGQSSITTTLKNAIRNEQLAQAFLFCGPRGVGKTTCARILAKTINCQKLTSSIEPCNECDACRNFNVSASFNIHELDAASNNKVEDIRALVEQVRIPPQGVRYKVYIIDEVHMLSQAAFNAFLKTLEEPPPYAKFILATTEKHKILPTIISRCQVFDFKRITAEDMAKQMAYVAEKESVTAEMDALHIIAQKADGSMRDALSIFDQIVSFSGNTLTYQSVIDNLNILDFDYYFKLTDFLLDGNISSSLILFNDVIENGFDGQYFLSGLGQHFRNLLVSLDSRTIQLLEAGETLRKRYEDQGTRCSPSFLLKSLDILSTADIHYKESNNKRLLVELTLAKQCALMRAPVIQAENRNHAGLMNEADKSEKVNLPKPQAPTITVSKDTYSSQAATTSPKPAISSNTGSIPGKPSEKVSKSTQFPGTVSIKEIMDTSDSATEVKNALPENNSDLPKEDFSQEQLEAAWDAFSETIKLNDSNLYTTLNFRKPLITEKNKIEFIIYNKVQEVQLLTIQSEMISFLRKELNNFSIELIFSFTPDDNTGKPFTSAEKYKAMIEKNPAIEKLRNQLDLNLEA